MKALQKMNALQNKKGFTLVEVIVVLVILAILIALLTPSLTGYIDKAKNKSVVVEARAVLIAAQTLASENYAKNITTAPDADDVEALAEVPGEVSAITLSAKNKILTFTYVSSGLQVTYSSTPVADATDGNYNVGPAPTTP